MINVESELDLSGLERFKKEYPEELDNAIERSVREMQDLLVNDILNQPGTGRLYPSNRGSGRHRASAPGDAPAPDTNTYRNSWKVDKISEHVWALFTADDRAQTLELGSVNMAPRPHLTPAVQRHRDRHTEIIRDALNRAFD